MEQQEIQTLRALMEYEAARTDPQSFPHLPDIPAGRYTDPAFLNWNKPRFLKNHGSSPPPR
ncbi:MAG: hypothetical protein CM15mP74_16380 [Halieaceae bacterium]|nr:MAG: hypothetical protein CM15mP74_16380 [Halieaceae bacterium]